MIGSCLVSPVGRTTVVQSLRPDDFHFKAHRLIYTVIVELDDKGDVDVVTVADRLKAKGELEEVGGMSYLFECVNICPFINVPDAYVAIVKQKSKRRQLWNALTKGRHVTENETKPFEDVQNEVEGLVFGVRDPARSTITPEEWGDMFETEVALTTSGQEGRKRVLTGLKNVDENMNCWPGRLTTIAGDTGIGKSVATTKIVREGGLRLKQRGYTWLGEMDKGEFWERVCAAELNIDYGKIQRRTTTMEEAARISEWMKTVYKQAPITVRDTDDGILTVADIRADCRNIAYREGPIDFICIDYLLLLGDLNGEVEGSDRRDVRIGNIVWNLIMLSRELKCHVFLVHQFNRTKSARTTGRPRLSDLKESSAIEQHSYNVLLLYRPERDEALDPDEREVFRGWFEVIIAKARGGKVGNVWMNFRGDIQELSPKPRPWPGEKNSQMQLPGEMTAEKRRKERGR